MALLAVPFLPISSVSGKLPDKTGLLSYQLLVSVFFVYHYFFSALKARLKVKEFPICTEKAHLVTEPLRQTEGEPTILRKAKATAHFLDNRTVFIEEDELIVGNIASKPMGMEAGTMGPAWPSEDMEELRKTGLSISAEDEKLLRSLNDYWLNKGRTLDKSQGQFYDDERMWLFIESGILCPLGEEKRRPWAGSLIRVGNSG